MTREELREHCERQIQQFERVEKIMPVTPNDLKRYEEHKLILELLEQEQKTGHWIAQNIHNCHTDFKCSKCGYIHNFLHLYGEPTADYTYCPNCGAKMEGEKE